MDYGPAGAPYAAGELIVTYEEGASDGAVESLDEQVGAEVEGDLPRIDASLFEFPEVEGAPSGEVREEERADIKTALEQDPAVESVDYNYLRTLSYASNDPKLASSGV